MSVLCEYCVAVNASVGAFIHSLKTIDPDAYEIEKPCVRNAAENKTLCCVHSQLSKGQIYCIKGVKAVLYIRKVSDV